MFRHVVLFTWGDAVTEEHKREVDAELRKLPGTIEEVRDYRVGPDAGLNPGNRDFAVVADFDDAAGYLVYRDHPLHRALVEKYITGHATERAALQYEC